jgi:hypothetical protein
MIRACIEIGGETDHFSVVVCAENIQQAVRFVADLYPDCAVRVRFPLDPETFFIANPAGEAEMLALVTPDRQRDGSNQNGANPVRAVNRRQRYTVGE